MAIVTEGEILAGKYKIERVLARGGMGVVVAAFHTQLEQRVALKFLLPEGEQNDLARGRFLREARAAVRLRSEHVARVLDVGTAEAGSPYIVMEYLEGRDLSALLSERGSLPVSEAVSYVLQAAEAVAEAHACGIIHRDLKPANLFLTHRPDGSPCVKVLDFGISKTSGDTASLTQTRAIIGTPHYLSPEQVRSSKSADIRSDIWAMGMILYELITGVVAFPRETLPELCSAIILDPIPPVRLKVPDIDPTLESVIGWSLSKSPENRPQTLAELASALAPFCSGGDASALRIARVLGGAPRASAPDLSAYRTPSQPEVAPHPESNEPPLAKQTVLMSAATPEASVELPMSAPSPMAASSADVDPPVSMSGILKPRGWTVAVGIALALMGVIGLTLALASGKPHAPTPVAPSSTTTAPVAIGSVGATPTPTIPSPPPAEEGKEPAAETSRPSPPSPPSIVATSAQRAAPKSPARPPPSVAPVAPTSTFPDMGPRK